MTYSTLPSLKQTGLVSALSLSGLALVSLLGTSPSLAAAHPPDLSEVSAAEPVLVANLFRQIGDAIRSVGEIADTVNTVDSLLQQITGSGAAQSEPTTAPQSATPGTSPAPATAQSPGL
jgi:hypothetical protein